MMRKEAQQDKCDSLVQTLQDIINVDEDTERYTSIEEGLSYIIFVMKEKAQKAIDSFGNKIDDNSNMFNLRRFRDKQQV